MSTDEHALPLLYVPRLLWRADEERPGLTEEGLRQLLERLDEAGAETPGIGAWLGGVRALERLDHPFALATADTRPRRLARWMQLTTEYGYDSVLFCGPEAFGEGGALAASSLPLLTGHGVAIANRGASDGPLVGRDVGSLRTILETSRDRLEALAGHPVRSLAPEPTPTGHALDGLVRREARRAGYDLVFAPATRPSRLGGEGDPTEIGYLTCYTSDDLDRLVRWVTGGRGSRTWTQLRRLVDAPRRVIDRVVGADKQ